MNKDKSIVKFLELINHKFGNNTLSIVDHWDIFDAIGLQKENKLIYIEHLKSKYYFYECELLVDDPEEVYIVQDSEDNVTGERLLEVISKFFDIGVQSTNPRR